MKVELAWPWDSQGRGRWGPVGSLGGLCLQHCASHRCHPLWKMLTLAVQRSFQSYITLGCYLSTPQPCAGVWATPGCLRGCFTSVSTEELCFASSQEEVLSDTCADNLITSCYLFTTGSFKPLYCQLLHHAVVGWCSSRAHWWVVSCKELILKYSNKRRAEIKLCLM